MNITYIDKDDKDIKYLLKLRRIKYRKRKINKIKYQKNIIIIIFIITIILLILYLYLTLNKGKEKGISFDAINNRRESNTNENINKIPKEVGEIIKNKKINSYSNERNETFINETKWPISNKQINLNSIDKDLDEEYKDMQEYIYMVMNGSLYNPNEVFKESENPKISIVISVYNGEAYLKTALLSIENQDLKDIEIIMVDDCSKDNSVNLIKELMVKDPRTKLYQNEENKGALYTKTRGVLNAKGKYVMALDEDDMYVQRDAFSTLYSEAEKNNLDILGFASYSTRIHLKKGAYLHRYFKTDVIYQPDIPKRNYECNFDKCKRVGDIIVNYFFRTDLFIDIIKQIDDKYMNVKMNAHEDFLLFFLLTRKAQV